MLLVTVANQPPIPFGALLYADPYDGDGDGVPDGTVSRLAGTWPTDFGTQALRFIGVSLHCPLKPSNQVSIFKN